MTNLTLPDNDTLVQYTSIGETAFLYDFPILASDELKVSVDQVLQTLGVDYTLSGIGDAGGGTVTFTAATTAGEVITIWQDMPMKRETGFDLGAATLLPTDLNTEFARQVRHDQQIRREIRLALRGPVDDPSGSGIDAMPNANDRKGKYLYFDAVTGQPSVNALDSQALSLDGTSTYWDALSRQIKNLASPTVNNDAANKLYVDAAVAAGSSSGVDPSGRIVVTEAPYSATGDGVTDDTTAVTNAAVAAAALGAELFFPRGTYVVESVAVTTANLLCWRGEAGTTLLLRDDDTLGGNPQILIATDVQTVKLYNLKIDANSANSKVPASGIGSFPLIEVRHTNALAQFRDGVFITDGLEFEGAAGGEGEGTGCMRSFSYEVNSDNFSSFRLVKHTNLKADSVAEGFVAFHRGPAKLCIIDTAEVHNDGQYGIVARGQPLSGSNSTPFGFSADVSHNHFIETVVVNNVYTKNAAGGVFFQMVRSLQVSNWTEEERGINSYYDVAPANIAGVDTASNEIDAAPPTGFGELSLVRFTTTGTLPAPLIPDALYYVTNVVGSEFQLTNTAGGSVINITDVGTGTHSIEWLGLKYGNGFKEDDCLFDPDKPGKHIYDNIRQFDPSPHNSGRGIAVEESTPDTVSPVSIRSSVFGGNVNLGAIYPGERHFVDDLTIIQGNENYTYPTNSGRYEGSPISGPAIVAYKLRQIGEGQINLSVSDTMIFRDCEFDTGIAWGYAASADYTEVVLDNCLLNVGDNAARFIDIAATTTGIQHKVVIQNCKPPRNNTNGIDLRMLPVTTNSLFDILIDGGDVGLTTSGSSQSLDPDLPLRVQRDGRDETQVVTAGRDLRAGESGKTIYLNAAGGFELVLPPPALGLNFTFIVATAPTTAYTVTTDSGDDILQGTLLDIVGDMVAVTDQDTINFVASTSLVGDRLEVESDATNWYVKGISRADGGMTASVT